LRRGSLARVDLFVWELLRSVKVVQMVIVKINFEMAMRSQVSIDLEGRMDDLEYVSKLMEFRRANLLAAEVSTRGGITRPVFKKPALFVGFCLYGILSKFPCESGGGVAANINYQLRTRERVVPTYVHGRKARIRDLPSGRSRCL